MYTLILALAMASPEPAPAAFCLNVETNTEVIVFIKGQRINPGVTYRTEPLGAPVCVELTVRYTDGGEVKTKTFWIDLEPGYKANFTLTIYANPPLVLAC